MNPFRSQGRPWCSYPTHWRMFERDGSIPQGYNGGSSSAPQEDSVASGVFRECSGASEFELRRLQHLESRKFRDSKSWKLRNSNPKDSKTLDFEIFEIHRSGKLRVRISEFPRLGIPELPKFHVLGTS
ncbi:uncharacterized protein LOC108741633 [Agrilus planipennis]|uniref:Uncharacterized protein LOC108741633 n=1 Tax=Agrilus planipennis TaxID=224129 RepID=A0A7F5R6J4_AGRPL|nr:uncharacterized protein LOC108741633 [Agrilus planipennis]